MGKDHQKDRVCEVPMRPHTNDGAMESVECIIWVDICCMLDWIIGLCHKMAEMHFPGLLIASAKFRSMMGASHQPTFMSGCLTISHMCLPCLPN